MRAADSAPVEVTNAPAVAGRAPAPENTAQGALGSPAPMLDHAKALGGGATLSYKDEAETRAQSSPLRQPGDGMFKAATPLIPPGEMPQARLVKVNGRLAVALTMTSASSPQAVQVSAEKHEVRRATTGEQVVLMTEAQMTSSSSVPFTVSYDGRKYDFVLFLPALSHLGQPLGASGESKLRNGPVGQLLHDVSRRDGLVDLGVRRHGSAHPPGGLCEYASAGPRADRGANRLRGPGGRQPLLSRAQRGEVVAFPRATSYNGAMTTASALASDRLRKPACLRSWWLLGLLLTVTLFPLRPAAAARAEYQDCAEWGRLVQFWHLLLDHSSGAVFNPAPRA